MLTAAMPLNAPAIGRVIRSIQLNFMSLKALSAAKMKKVRSINTSPVIAPFKMPFCFDLNPIKMPTKRDKSFITMLTGIMTADGREVNLSIIANTSTSASAIRVAKSTDFKTSKISGFNSFLFIVKSIGFCGKI